MSVHLCNLFLVHFREKFRGLSSHISEIFSPLHRNLFFCNMDILINFNHFYHKKLRSQQTHSEDWSLKQEILKAAVRDIKECSTLWEENEFRRTRQGGGTRIWTAPYSCTAYSFLGDAQHVPTHISFYLCTSCPRHIHLFIWVSCFACNYFSVIELILP